jgi:hypothetical protein
LQLCIPLGTTFDLFLVLFVLDGADSWCYMLHFWGNLALVLHRAKQKLKITNYGPIKNLSPLLKGKGCHRKKNKKITSITHNIAEAHPHSKTWVCRCRPYHSICKNRVLTKILPERTFTLQLKLPHCFWVTYPSKHQMAWFDIFQSNFSIIPFYCFGLVLIDVLYGLKSSPFYGVFYYLAISFILYRSFGSY